MDGKMEENNDVPVTDSKNENSCHYGAIQGEKWRKQSHRFQHRRWRQNPNDEQRYRRLWDNWSREKTAKGSDKSIVRILWVRRNQSWPKYPRNLNQQRPEGDILENVQEDNTFVPNKG